MYAVIESGGKQYRVAAGDTIQVEKVAADVGTQIELPVKAISSDGSVRAGSEAASATVKATVTGHGRSAKVIVFKFKRKKQHKKTIGHRQGFTSVKIDEISA